MDKNTYLRIVLGVSIAGMLFSGYLTYNELSGISCTAVGGLLGIPTCLYGFAMYLAVCVLVLLALKTRK